MSSGGTGPATWEGEGVHVADIAAELDALHRSVYDSEGIQALARTLNLVVLPCSESAEIAVQRELEGLGSHAPSRTLVLRSGPIDRLDAEVAVVCSIASSPGRIGICHDRVALTSGGQRFDHASSLLAPLLVTDLPTVIWLPDLDSPIPDPRLLDRADHLLADSAVDGEPGLSRLAELARRVPVHDLAWGRLEYWRAATAAAFNPPERRALLREVSGLEVRYRSDAHSAALLLAGWVSARAGWRVGTVEGDSGITQVNAARPDGGRVAIRLNRDASVRGCGGIEELCFVAGSDEARVERRGATSRMRDMFAEALRPLHSFARGYAEAAEAAAGMALR